MDKERVDIILKNCPKAFSSLVEYNKANGEMFSQSLVQGVSIELFNAMLMINSVPRYLFDFFDHHNIFIKIYPIIPAESWGWSILDQNLIPQEEGIGGPIRINAENCAFEGAFAILETKL